jgi:hypothetical protein
MFWKKQSSAGENLPGPKDIPELAGRYLVVGLQQNPDWVWKLKGVIRPHTESKHLFDVRVFDGARVQQSNVKIKNYNSFDELPDLILFEGWYNNQSMQVQLKDRRSG